ncbi:MAG: nuclear transport factor 2 family protein [Chitinophagaceae bacterium]
MDANEIINIFYTCFQNKDYKGMQDCYADTAHFSDPVFINLSADQVKAMWEMFCVKGKNLNVDFKNISADENTANAEWRAVYTFSATGKKVVNHIKANFIIEQGKIAKHIDSFNFYNWSRQALGLPGLLLGWTPFIKNKIRRQAMKSLNDFMSKG